MGEQCERVNLPLEKREKEEKRVDESDYVDVAGVPVLWIKCDKPRRKFLLFFHDKDCSVAEVAGKLDEIAQSACVNVLAVEYPGYSFYRSTEQLVAETDENGGVFYMYADGENEDEEQNFASADVIQEVACRVYDRLLEKIPRSDLLVGGEGWGTGPACYLAGRGPWGKDEPPTLLLVNPFLSICTAVTPSGKTIKEWDNCAQLRNFSATLLVACTGARHGTEKILYGKYQFNKRMATVEDSANNCVANLLCGEDLRTKVENDAEYAEWLRPCCTGSAAWWFPEKVEKQVKDRREDSFCTVM